MAVFNQMGLELTPKLCLLDFLGGGLGWVGYGKSWKQAQLGVPHSRIQVELDFILQAGICQILNFAQNSRHSEIVQGTEINWGGTPHKKMYTGRWGHRTYFLNRVPIGGVGDTAHTFFPVGQYDQYMLKYRLPNLTGGWVGGYCRI